MEHNVAALFLKMSSIPNISENAQQEVIEQMNQIYVITAVRIMYSLNSLLMVDHCQLLKTSYISRELSLVMPLEFVLGNDKQTAVYISIIKMLQTLLSSREILEKAMSHEANSSEQYKAYSDGSRFKGNAFFE